MDPNKTDGQADTELDTGAPAEHEGQDAVPQDVASIAIDAFDEGAGLNGDDDADGADKPAKPGTDGGADDDSAADAPAAAKPETDEERVAREGKEAEAAEAAKVDQEVKDLGLKGKSEERWRDLTGRLKEATTKIEQLGGDEGLQRLVRDANDQQEWDRQLNQIGATPEQFGQAMGFIAAFNSTDPVILRQARDNLLKEVAVLDGRLGEKTDRHDPLAAHPDLVDKVGRGAMDEEDAIEVARLRTEAAARERREQDQGQQDQLAEQHQVGVRELSALGAALKTRDGDAVFDAVMKSIGADLNAMVGSMPVDKWTATAERLYGLGLQAMRARVNTNPSPAPPPRVGVRQPIRQQHATRGAAAVTKEHTDPMAAFDAGVEEVRARGY